VPRNPSARRSSLKNFCLYRPNLYGPTCRDRRLDDALSAAIGDHAYSL
jgi:hypothetical protein